MIALFPVFVRGTNAASPSPVPAPAHYVFVATLSNPDGTWSLLNGTFDLSSGTELTRTLNGTLTAHPSGAANPGTDYPLSGSVAASIDGSIDGQKFTFSAAGSGLSAAGEITPAGTLTGEITDKADAGKPRTGILSGTAAASSVAYLGSIDGDSTGPLAVVVAGDGTLNGVFGGVLGTVPVFGEPGRITHGNGTTDYLWRARTGDGFLGTVEATLGGDSLTLSGVWFTHTPGLRRGTWNVSRMKNSE